MIRTYMALMGLAIVTLAGCVSSSNKSPSAGNLAEPKGCASLLNPVRSAFVFHEVSTGRTYACNAERASQRFIPASTFKVPHAIIAMESGVVVDETMKFKWDGRPRGVNAWNTDTSLAEAMPASAVWVFQSIAARIGTDREGEAVRRLNYGNADVGGEADLRQFWLSGPLRISAIEQIEFFKKLRSGKLASDPKIQARTVAMLRLRDCGPDCQVFGKTGAVLPIDDDGVLRENFVSPLAAGTERTGWFVGWVERPDSAGGSIIFAHNIDLELAGAMPARTQIAYDILRANAVLPD